MFPPFSTKPAVCIYGFVQKNVPSLSKFMFFEYFLDFIKFGNNTAIKNKTYGFMP